MEKVLIAVGVVVLVLLLILARAWARSIKGVWVQEEGDGWLEILVDHTGPMVSARCYVDGGHYEYSGLWTGGSVRLKRRDFGEQMLKAKGFPDAIIEKVQGSVMAKLSLRLKDADTLNGFFYPHEIRWNRAKTHVESRRFMDPKWRTWFRRDSAAARALIKQKEDERRAREEAARQDGPSAT